MLPDVVEASNHDEEMVTGLFRLGDAVLLA